MRICGRRSRKEVGRADGKAELFRPAMKKSTESRKRGFSLDGAEEGEEKGRGSA